MKTSRRAFRRGAAAAAFFPRLAVGQQASGYPTRPVRWIVASPPGGIADLLARVMGQWLTERLGQPFVIENRPGGGTNIGTEAVVRAAPDGHTLLLVSPANAINATLYDKLNFNFIRDITPVAGLLRAPNVMVVHPSIPARNVQEFVAYAKAKPGTISYASFGIGTSLHVTGELLKMMTGIDMVHVPFRGTAQALTALLAGEVQVMFDNISSSIAHIRDGKLRALAVTTTKRSELLPEVPSVGEFLPGFESSAFFGVGAPHGTPDDVIATLNREINAGLADLRIGARLAEVAGPVLPGSPGDFARVIRDETEKWAKVVAFAHIKAE